MNVIIEAIASRRARRALSPSPLPPETLSRIIAAATLAPSCMNKQPWRFLVIESPEALEKARRALSEGNYWARTAPVLVAAVTDPDLDCRLSDKRDYALFDSGLAVGNLLAQATAEGLIAHPIAGFDPVALKTAFGIADSFIVIALVVIGLPGDEAGLSEKHRESEHSLRQRKSETEVIFRNEWGQ
jgi:nitroreductase